MAVKQNDMNDRTVPVSAVRKSFKLQTLIAALVIVVTSLAWFTAPPTAAAAEAQQFGDWILRCETKGDGELCYLHQTINYSKGDVSGVLLDIKIGALADDDDLYALLMLPLGLNIPSGAIIGADAGEPTPLTIQTCTKEGCRSIAKISKELLWGFRKGQKLKAGFVPFGRTQTIVVEASLTGFTAAFKAMRTR